jgi:hypothetical protein
VNLNIGSLPEIREVFPKPKPESSRNDWCQKGTAEQDAEGEPGAAPSMEEVVDGGKWDENEEP